MRRTSLTGIIAAALVAVSCSIKEDRGPCPCWLEIDLHNCRSVLEDRDGQTDSTRIGSVSVSAWNEGLLFGQRIARKDFRTALEMTVPKSSVATSVVAGEEEMTRDGYRLLIPSGGDADEIWAHSGLVSCFGETARDTAVLHKQFARVKVKVTNPVGSSYPYTFRLRSEVCGLDLRDLTPLEGQVETDLVKGKDDIMEFNLIRQREDSRLELDVLGRGKVLKTMPLDAWIRELDYSWLAEDLKDIFVTIDYAKGEISIKVNGWADGGSIKIEI